MVIPVIQDEKRHIAVVKLNTSSNDLWCERNYCSQLGGNELQFTHEIDGKK